MVARASNGAQMSPDPADRRVVIVTGASQGIGANLSAALRAEGYAVVATSRSIHASEEHEFLTVPGDITQVETAQRWWIRRLPGSVGSTP